MALEGFDLFGSGAGTSIAGTAVGAATGNPIAMIAGIAGIATSVFGGVEQANVQKKEASLSADISGLEGQMNQVRQNLATATYHRQQTENLRKTQQSIALSKAAAVQGGAQFGSGAAGGQAQATEEGAFNQFNLSTEYQFGQKEFDISNQISQKQVQLAQLGGQAATYGGIAAAGQGLTSGAMALGRLTGGFGGQY